MSFSLGQRWISDSESELGLGAVVAVESRMVTLMFPATGENRLYAINEAPVTRVIFNIGDEIAHVDEWTMTVEAVDLQGELLIYRGKRCDSGEEAEIKEIFLSHFLKFNKPQDRLFAGQIDRFERFVTRYQTLTNNFYQQQSPLKGLIGGKVSLIPHQLHIASEVGRRYAPRVLLADEVGLGKTIEAGLIIHQQIISGLANRVLILVPDALQYQWLVEMLRRFNLHFSIFDEERCVEAYADSENPFDTEQLVLCSLDFIRSKKRRFEQIVEADWDLMIVDEAHHLRWDEDKPSRAYQVVEALAQATPGVLLLTATPDQLGHRSHFARLRLLDPERFYDYNAFLNEENQYKHVAEAAEPLLARQPLELEQSQRLIDALKDTDISSLLATINGDDEAAAALAREDLLSHLLDRHGTGRVLFRNTRGGVDGFPDRHLSSYALKLPTQYQTALRVANAMGGKTNEQQKAAQLLFPEELYQSFEGEGTSWTQYDPRIQWLLDFLLANKQKKVLVICAKAHTALAIEEAARVEEGIRGTIFHEDMSIMERDKAAAYFAQDEAGAQLLVCSEIGSEGRNFQFSHHLVLFDLPTNPDLLEQRIGRLDRIGQQHDVRIHVPYIEGTAQEVLLRWYHESLSAFETTCPSGSAVFERYSEHLLSHLANSECELSLDELIEQSRDYHLSLKAEMDAGRDRLLEIHSAGGTKADALIEQIKASNQDHQFVSDTLRLFDTLGIHQDDLGENTLLLKPGEQMLISSLPGLPEDGCLITYDRDTSLRRDEVQLMTWDHPIIRGAMDAILSSDTGSTSVALLKNKALSVGSFFLEAIYVAESSAPAQYQLGKYLPATPIRILLDKNGNDLSTKVAFDTFNQQLSPVNRHIGSKLVGASQTAIHPLITASKAIAEQKMNPMVEAAKDKARMALDGELARLESLKAVNPSIRDDELAFLREQRDALQDYISKAQLKLDAIRFIIVAHQ
jgi:ATP-dependent helicase HepA